MKKTRKRPYKCSVCQKSGHNKRTCPKAAATPRKKIRKGKNKVDTKAKRKSAAKKKNNKARRIQLRLKFSKSESWSNFKENTKGKPGIYWMTCGVHSIYIGICMTNSGDGIYGRWENDHDYHGVKWPKGALEKSNISDFQLRVNKTRMHNNKAALYYWLHEDLKGTAATISKQTKNKKKLLESIEHIMIHQTAKTRQKAERVKSLKEYCKCWKKSGKKRKIKHGVGGRKQIPPTSTLINSDKVSRAKKIKSGRKKREWWRWLDWTRDKFGAGKIIIEGTKPSDSRKISGKSIHELCSQSMEK